ncbi:MAG: NUDIX domain-containing protein [Candidatus Kerfeldbacteria bacterium]|nr:NUDIX domain-containing protein [Candidatus Kerfeldbacteria bacterium]
MKQTPQNSKSVGAIVVNTRGHILLVFQQLNQYWEFPKGKVEQGEREIDTLTREIYEETGIKRFHLVEGFRRSMHYDFHYQGELIRRKVVYFLIQTRDRVRISHEHTRYAWLPIEKAKRRLKHQNQRDLLDEVKQLLTHQQRTAAQQ